MRFDKNKIISELNLAPFGSQGWFSNKNMECPFCGKKGKWGVIFNENGVATFHCWKCPRKTSLYDFLQKIGRKDLCHINYRETAANVRLPKLEAQGEVSEWMQDTSTKEDFKSLKPINLPLRIKPLTDDEYLNKRGFREEHYREFEPSYTDSALEKRLNNYIIFKMKIDGVPVAWWARSRYSKEWHKRNLEAYKAHKEDLMLRYRNSENNFQDLLGGYDFLQEGVTDTVILVEGIFDFVNIWNILGLRDIEWLKCCFTFGNSIGRGQIDMLQHKRVKNILLLYDYGTVQESKETSLLLSKNFESVRVANIDIPGVDPGNITVSQLNEVLANAQDPMNFYLNHI
jgi:hypothetical protein